MAAGRLLKLIYLLLVLFLILAPFVFIVYRAVTFRTPQGIEFVGLRYFSQLTFDYWKALLNSILIGLTVAFVDFLLAFPVAYILARYRFKFHRLLTAILVAPMFTPDVVAGLGLMLIYIKVYGLESSILGTILGLASTSYPLMLLPLLASIRSMDPVYEDVAKSLGARPLRVIFSVVLPMSAQGIFSGFVLSFVWSINNYLIPLFITGPAIDLLAVKLYSDVRWWGLLGRVAAEASLLQFITFLAVLLYLKIAGERAAGGFAL